VLFDLKGRRRRVVQATYLLLAVLMGGGLVFFGIGGDVSGGLFDAFSERGGSGSNIVEERIEDNEKKLETNPRDRNALKDLVRDWYSLANDEADPNTGQFTEEGMNRLRNADEAWQRYTDVVDKPDRSLLQVALQIYDIRALNQPEEAADVAEELTAAQPRNPQAFVLLVQYAAAAGQDRKADLAAQRALDLAETKQERRQIKTAVDQAKAQAAFAQQGGEQAP
jgi:hypothetical protein